MCSFCDIYFISIASLYVVGLPARILQASSALTRAQTYQQSTMQIQQKAFSPQSALRWRQQFSNSDGDDVLFSILFVWRFLGRKKIISVIEVFSFSWEYQWHVDFVLQNPHLLVWNICVECHRGLVEQMGSGFESLHLKKL